MQDIESAKRGQWVLMNAKECCQISRIPVSVYPMRAYNPDMAHGWEGKDRSRVVHLKVERWSRLGISDAK